ncbi:MAG: hypothetical protein HY763_17160 [Planctomycetes bacterium]|nr:hypothetical protein [Planctomycetota bacterium]
MPYEQVGPFHFGMRLSELEALLRTRSERIHSFDEVGLARAFFSGLGLFVDYCRPDISVGFELIRPCDPIFQGIHLLDTPFCDLREAFAMLDPYVADYDSGFTSMAFGIRPYAPFHLSNPLEVPEAVYIFEQGCFEKYGG